MKIYVKNKLVSLGGSSTIKDANGNDIFKVKGKFLSLTRKKKILDMEGKLHYVVKNRFFNFWTHASFIYSAEKQKLAKLSNRAFKTGFDVKGYGDEISIDGWLLTGCTIYKNGEKIGSVNSKALALSDTFEVEVNDNEDPAFIVALIIAMDNVRDKATKTRS